MAVGNQAALITEPELRAPGARAGSASPSRGAGLPGGLAIAVASACDLVVAWLFTAAPHTTLSCAVALAFHAGAAAPLLLAQGLPWSRRWLLVGFAVTLPVMGAPIAAAALAARGRPAVFDEAPEEERVAPPLDVGAIRRFAETPPAPEVLLSAGADDRRALLSALGRRADAQAVAILRWALTATPPEVGMEAALALEDMSTTFERNLAAARAELARAPSGAVALATADLITRGVEAQMIDPSRVSALAAEARRWYAAALELDAAAAAAVALGRARLELALLRPDAALEALDQALPALGPEARAEMSALRQEALLRSHRLPWEGSSLLASYRPAPPPPFRRVDPERRRRALAAGGVRERLA